MHAMAWPGPVFGHGMCAAGLATHLTTPVCPVARTQTIILQVVSCQISIERLGESGATHDSQSASRSGVEAWVARNLNGWDDSDAGLSKGWVRRPSGLASLHHSRLSTRSSYQLYSFSGDRRFCHDNHGSFVYDSPNLFCGPSGSVRTGLARVRSEPGHRTHLTSLMCGVAYSCSYVLLRTHTVSWSWRSDHDWSGTCMQEQPSGFVRIRWVRGFIATVAHSNNFGLVRAPRAQSSISILTRALSLESWGGAQLVVSRTSLTWSGLEWRKERPGGLDGLDGNGFHSVVHRHLGAIPGMR